MAKVVSDQSARGGKPGRPVLYVLIASFALVAIYLVSLLGWSGATTDTSPQQAASQQSVGGGASSSNTSRTPTGNPAYPAPAAGSTTGSTTPAPQR